MATLGRARQTRNLLSLTLSVRLLFSRPSIRLSFIIVSPSWSPLTPASVWLQHPWFMSGFHRPTALARCTLPAFMTFAFSIGFKCLLLNACRQPSRQAGNSTISNWILNGPPPPKQHSHAHTIKHAPISMCHFATTNKGAHLIVCLWPCKWRIQLVQKNSANSNKKQQYCALPAFTCKIRCNSSPQNLKLNKTELVWEENFSQKCHDILVPWSLRTEQQRLTHHCFWLSRTLDWDLSQLCGGWGVTKKKSFSPPGPLYPITSSNWHPSQPVAEHFRDTRLTLLGFELTQHKVNLAVEILLYDNNERSKEILLKYNVTAEVLWPSMDGGMDGWMNGWRFGGLCFKWQTEA